jgi:hypothetical protein
VSSAYSAEWLASNQRGLMAEVWRLASLLERHATAAHAAADPPTPDVAVPRESRAPALDAVCEAFGLSAFERSVLLLCAAMELDSSFADRCASAQGDPHRAYPTWSLALAALPDAHWSALSPAGPLRRWKLIDLGPGPLLTQSPLHVDERILHYLAGVPYLDHRLSGLVEPVATPDTLPPSQRVVARRIVGIWTSTFGDPGAMPAVVQLVGDAASTKRAVAAAACHEAGFDLYALRGAHVPTEAAEQETLARLWGREAVLGRSVLLLDAEDADSAERTRVTALLDRTRGLVLVAVREPLGGLRRPETRLEVRRPRPEEQRAEWRRQLGPAWAGLNGQIDALVGHFSLDLDAIRSACLGAVAMPETPDDGLGDWLWEACRSQARSRLDELAQRIEPGAGWDDLVLPARQRELLVEIVGQVRQRQRVYGDWGFGTAGTRGLGITALFAGPSGTGKTMAAEVLAGELHLDLYRIDLSQVVSKYIGETEKNLRRVFDAAEGSGAILLFDEADALFGKRSEVKDSHDRYANIEVSYLLQRMETYRGLAILTTNLKSALDPAFLRRLRFIVAFPFPDAAQREEIWRRVFPRQTPTEGLDPTQLARLSIAGGNIRNIALHAAFLAADAGGPVRMAHVLRAARGEYGKLDRTLTETEIAGWV